MASDTETAYCHGHPDTATRLQCTRCDKPICGRCAVPASVGQHCVWCVAEARKSAPKVQSALRAGSPVVLGIIVVTVVAWIAQSIGNLAGNDLITRYFASYPPAIAEGQWWRLLTPMFLHLPFSGGVFSLVHIGFNMFILRAYGPNVEEAFGRARFLAMYLIMGFTGSALSYAFGRCFVTGVGASGAIFGIVGVLIVYLYRRRTSVVMAQYMKNLFFFVGINLFIGLTLPGVDNMAHLGGLFGGLALGATFDDGTQRQRPVAIQVAGAAAVIAAGVGLVAWRTATASCGL